MIGSLLLVLIAVWITWLLFRDDDSERMAQTVSGHEPEERDRGPRGDE
jgi:hypothetical protein